MHSGYTLRELSTLWDKGWRPTEWNAIRHMIKGDDPSPATEWDRFQSLLKAGILMMCSDCGQPRKREEFYKDKTRKAGVRSECKFCTNRRDAQRYKPRRKIG